MKCMIENRLAAAGYVKVENVGGTRLSDVHSALEANGRGDLTDALNRGIVVPGFGCMALDEAAYEKALAEAVDWKINNGNSAIVIVDSQASGIWCKGDVVAADYRPYTRAGQAMVA